MARRSRLAHLWRHHRTATLAFGAMALLTLVLATRAALFALYWADPGKRDQAIAGWMTPRYVAHSWQVPPQVVRAALGDPAMPARSRTLEDIARDSGVPLATLIAALEAEIARHRAQVPPR